MKYILIPLKLLVILVGLLLMVFVVSADYATDPSNDSWDDKAWRYIRKLVRIL